MALRLSTLGSAIAIASTLVARPELSPTPPIMQVPAGAKVVKGLAIYRPKPKYPHYARACHWGGVGWYLMRVDKKTGVVTSVEITQSTGHRMLDQAAVDALRRWKFKPGVTAARTPITFTPLTQKTTQ